MASRPASDGSAPVSRGEPVSLGAERVRALEAERQSLVSILGTLRNAGPVTRLDLERETHLGRAVIVDRLATLSAFGLVEENGVGRSIGGRAPKLLRFRAEAGRLLVANMDGSTVGIGLADLSGRLLLEHYEDVAPDLPSPSLYERLEALFAWALGEGGAPLWGIGLGVPGTVDFEQEVQLAVPRFSTSPDWNESRLVERLAVRFGAPVFARSAVQTATMGEITALPPERASDLIFVDLGTSISTGLVSSSQLLRGAQGIAGQMGHIYMGEGSTLVCGCGNVGCLQTVAGCEAIAREGERAASEGQSPALAAILARSGAVTVDDIGTASRLGDPFSADILAQAGRLVGTTLAGLVNIFNPATLVIGGDLAQTGDICLAAIREAVYRHAQPLASRDLSILRSRMGRSAGLVGAATVVAEELFAAHFLEAWITSGTPLAHPKVLTFLQAAAGAA